MADNDKNDDAEFDFGGPDWEDELDSAEGKGKPAASDSDPFGAAAFDDDEDDGAAFAAEEGAEDVFATAAADPFADSEDEPFAFQDMPTPGAISDAPVASGDPDEEFGDLGDGGFAESDGFTGGGALFDDEDHEREEAPANDPFSDEEDASGDVGGFKDEMTDDDPFGDAEGEGEEPYANEASAPAPAAARPRRNIVKPLALAASVAFAGYIGYTVLLPMLMQPSVPEAPAQVAEAPSAPSFPAALPGQPGGLEVAPAPVTAPSPSVELPTVAGAPPVLAPAETAPLELPPAMTPGPDSPPVMVPAGQDNVALNVPAPAQPVQEALPQPSKPAFDEFVGGEERGGIDAMKGADGKAVEAADSKALAGLEARIAAVETRVGELADRIDAALSAPGSIPALPAPSAEPAAADLSRLVPPLKPTIIEGATLKGVSRGLAWISTPSGVVEVRKGDTVPNGGKVLSIRQYGDGWIVVTTDGVVVR